MSITEATDHLTATVERQRKEIEQLRNLLKQSSTREYALELRSVEQRTEIRNLQIENSRLGSIINGTMEGEE